jgi:hypothetical protein
VSYQTNKLLRTYSLTHRLAKEVQSLKLIDSSRNLGTLSMRSETDLSLCDMQTRISVLEAKLGSARNDHALAIESFNSQSRQFNTDRQKLESELVAVKEEQSSLIASKDADYQAQLRDQIFQKLNQSTPYSKLNSKKKNREVRERRHMKGSCFS